MNDTHRIAPLDGLRGLAALWVLLGHAALLSHFYFPILSEPDLGVDLFIMLSGFLMVHQYTLRAAREPWESPATLAKFWTRRFFRIAPLYYVALIVALAAGPAIYDARLDLDTFRKVLPQTPERYLDASPTNILLHISFLFGFLPSHAFRAPLPDWSIGLEMQFYAAFPFLMLLIRRFDALTGGALIAALAFVIAMLAGQAGLLYPMPAFLPLKMHIFLCGMMIASMATCTDRNRAMMLAGAAMIFAILPVTDHSVVKLAIRLGMVISFVALIYGPRWRGIAGKLLSHPAAILSSKPFFLLGELSYGAYLIHLLVMQPVGAFLLDSGVYEARGAIRFLALSAATLTPTYVLAFIGYRLIETTGQQWGRMLVSRMGGKRLSPS